MSENLAAAAAALGTPEALVERSAAARAAATGVEVEVILAAWAGGGTVPSAPAGGTDAPAADIPSVEDPAPVVEEAPPAAIESEQRSRPAAATAVAVLAPAAPPSVSMREAAGYEAVTTVGTVGLKERTSTGIPRWLTLIFTVLPLAALTYLISFSTGPNCGTAGQLAVDRQTGVAENCDGSEFAIGGGAGGVDARAVIGQGQAIYAAAPGNCTTCHGAGGGGGTGPALAGGAVVSTFASCADHIEWVELGSNGFQSAGRTSYGDADRPVAGGMPGFASLGPDDLAAVVLFERVNFGGQDPTEALEDCGLVEPAEEGGDDTPAEGEEGADGAPAEGEGGGDGAPAEGEEADTEALAG